MHRFLSLLKNHSPGVLLTIYFFSFWILPQGWDESSTLDGSWRYAFSKFRQLGLALGNDSWFTYGPLAHWFGEPMGLERFYPLPFYLLGLFVAVIIGISFTRLVAEIDLSFRLRVVATLVFPLSFIGMVDVHEVHFVIALFLLLITCCLKEIPDNLSFFSMIILSACGLLYKLSLGILSLFVLMMLLGPLVIRKKISVTMISLYLAGYVAIVYVLFVVTSGSYDLLKYCHP